MYDIAMARALITTVQFAKNKKLNTDRVCDPYTFSESHCRHEIDIIQDTIRIFERRSQDPADKQLYDLARSGEKQGLALPKCFHHRHGERMGFPVPFFYLCQI